MTMRGSQLPLGLALVLILQVTLAQGYLWKLSTIIWSDEAVANTAEVPDIENVLDAAASSDSGSVQQHGARQLLAFGGPQPPPLRSVGGKPCVPSSVKISIFNVGSFSERLRYPNNLIVRLVLQNNIYFPRGFTFDSRYSCTIITSAPGAQRVLGTMSGSDQTLSINGANNVMVSNVQIKGRPPPRAGQYDKLRCGTRNTGDNYWEGNNYWCSAFHVSNSWNVWLVKSSIYGRVDVFSSSSVYIDSNYIEGAYNLYAGVLVGGVGDALNALMGNVFITNNQVNANNATCGIAMQHGAVGVTVKNNNILGFNQYGVSCGYGVSTNMDCMLSVISFNYIERLEKFVYAGAQAGLYFNTHWTGPGNVAECNYIVKASRCYMFDLATSGTMVLSGVCIDNGWAFSQNNGNYNMAVNQVIINSHSIGGMNMQNWLGLRCGLSAGNSWNAAMQKMARNPRLKALFPWLTTDFCTRTTFKNVPCNQRVTGSPYRFYSAAQTGRCSGIPQGNFFQFAAVNNLLPLNSRFQWENAAPAMPLMNQMTGIEAPRPSPTQYLDLKTWGFNNPAAGDFGVQPSSPIRKKYPNFQSCPRSTVGPHPVSDATYWALYNTPKAPLRPYRLPYSNYPFPR